MYFEIKAHRNAMDLPKHSSLYVIFLICNAYIWVVLCKIINEFTENDSIKILVIIYLYVFKSFS